jgi:outer membrane protein OmpA-like peptidoglycan-associated protein
VVNLQSDILFDFDKAKIKPAAQQALTKVALIIKKKGTGRVLIAGHTDAKGSEAYNQKLSERRAMAVKNWLVQHGAIAPDRLVTKGYGEARPVAPNTHPDGTDNPEGRARNRRVEITISTVQNNG